MGPSSLAVASNLTLTFLLMPWPCASPEYWQRWYYQCSINEYVSSMKQNFHYNAISVLRNERTQYISTFREINSTLEGLTHCGRDKMDAVLADDIFKCIFLNEIFEFLLNFLWSFVPKGPMNNIPALVQIMAWRRPGDKPLSESMMVSLPWDYYL